LHLIFIVHWKLLQVYGGKGEQKHRQIQFGGSAQQVIFIDFWPFDVSRRKNSILLMFETYFFYYYHCFLFYLSV